MPSLLPSLVWKDTECKTRITFLCTKKSELIALQRAEKALNAIGVTFNIDHDDDTSTHIWEWGDSLDGPISVTFQGKV